MGLLGSHSGRLVPPPMGPTTESEWSEEERDENKEAESERKRKQKQNRGRKDLSHSERGR